MAYLSQWDVQNALRYKTQIIKHHLFLKADDHSQITSAPSTIRILVCKT